MKSEQTGVVLKVFSFLHRVKSCIEIFKVLAVGDPTKSLRICAEGVIPVISFYF